MAPKHHIFTMKPYTTIRSVRKCVSPHGPREFLGPGPTGATRSSRGGEERSKPRDERMKEQRRRRAQQGAEGGSAGRAVGADFLNDDFLGCLASPPPGLRI